MRQIWQSRWSGIECTFWLLAAFKQNFAADNDIDAIRIAQVLYDACSDTCEGFEVWEGCRVLHTRPPPYPEVTCTHLAEHLQRIVIEKEEMMSASNYVLRRSRRLLENLAAMKSGMIPAKH